MDQGRPPTDAAFWLNDPARRWPLADGPPPDRFQLRGLLWCDWCQVEMTPHLDDQARYYRCGCRAPVHAAELEQLVWHRFQQANVAYAHSLHPGQRRNAIRRLISRIRLGDAPHQVRFDWRD